MRCTHIAAAALVGVASAFSIPVQAALADPPPVDPMANVSQDVVKPGSTADLEVFCSPLGRHSTLTARSPAFEYGQATLHRTVIVGVAWRFAGKARIVAADGFHGRGRIVRLPVEGSCPGGGSWHTDITVDRGKAPVLPSERRGGVRAKVGPRVTHPGGRVTVWVRCLGDVPRNERSIDADSRAFGDGPARLHRIRGTRAFRGRARIAGFHELLHRGPTGMHRHTRWAVYGLCPNGEPWHTSVTVVRGHRHHHHRGHHRFGHGQDGDFPGMGPQLGAGGTSSGANSPEIAAGGLLAGAVIGAGWMVMRRHRLRRLEL